MKSIITILALLYAPLIAASGCTLPPCGRVENNTPYHMLWADLGKNNGKCKLWNVDRPVNCEQKDVNGGVGGWFHDKIDVDAFCFPSNGYWMKFGSGPGETYIRAGEWVKINSAQTARCTNDGTTIHCKV